MNQFLVRVAIFDQDNFDEALDNRVTVISQEHHSWNYEDVLFKTDLSDVELSEYLDHLYNEDDVQLDWGFVPEDEELDQNISL
ncbi:hypothetical protein HAU32_09280 [Weissella confusa]|uniref:Uncharacterized protein n=1 Tax=Weissella fermenti TaxID=2987699 RepID=A0ABT6D5M7_9LACO|nr:MULTISPECIES: hypothetical protein [Weissella]MBJ7689156.1 hypothetical protein [Weissella confusa]MCW0927882.1 hypothetical protein [Weissella sp. LMG 11983]MDF9300820.1 hypothetical protein [Weissella sp. BK2]